MSLAIDHLGLSDDTVRSLLWELSNEAHNIQILELFDENEMQDIMENLLVISINIVGNKRCVDFAVKYIEYQLQLLKTIQTRYASKKLTVDKTRLESLIRNNVKMVYKNAVVEFEDGHLLFISYVRYFLKLNETDDIVDWAMFFLLKDVTNATIWLVLRRFYRNESMELRKVMWVVMPKLSAKYVATVISEKDAEGEETCIKKLCNLIHMAFRYISCSYFNISILDRINDDGVLKRILEEFEHNHLMWNALAQQLWRLDVKSPDSVGPVIVRSPKLRLQQSINKYKEGIRRLKSKSKTYLWRLLINFLFFLYNHGCNDGLSNELKLRILHKYLNIGIKRLGPLEYLRWMRLEKDPTEFSLVAVKAVTAFPKCVTIWCERLKFEFQKQDTSGTNSIFRSGVEQLKEKSLQLWRDMIYYNEFDNIEEAEKLYWEACEFCYEVSSHVRPMFLKWIFLRTSIINARVVYDQLVDKEPHSKEMYVTMSELENMLIEDYFDESLAEKVHTDACSRFGGDIDVWINYAQFIYNLNKRRGSNLTERVRVIYNNGLIALPPDLHSEFRKQFGKILPDWNS